MADREAGWIGACGSAEWFGAAAMRALQYVGQIRPTIPCAALRCSSEMGRQGEHEVSTSSSTWLVVETIPDEYLVLGAAEVIQR